MTQTVFRGMYRIYRDVEEYGVLTSEKLHSDSCLASMRTRGFRNKGTCQCLEFWQVFPEESFCVLSFSMSLVIGYGLYRGIGDL